MKKVLVHTCCADCALKMTEAIQRDMDDVAITLYFYNPNIHPESEWQARKNAVKQVFEGKSVSLTFTNWTPKDYFAVVKSPTGRCAHCWQLRLEKTFAYAATHDFEMVTSTLFTSVYHDQTVLRGIAAELGTQYGVGVYYPEVVDHEMKTSGFFKQNYCGCIHSLNEKYAEKFQ
jgi:predicted adenine nucleotide alpha hydrolase (AANH) superfamily ATPase